MLSSIISWPLIPIPGWFAKPWSPLTGRSGGRGQIRDHLDIQQIVPGCDQPDRHYQECLYVRRKLLQDLRPSTNNQLISIRGPDQGNPEDQGAGDQGMMFGLPPTRRPGFSFLALDLSHRLLIELAKLRQECNGSPHLRPDADPRSSRYVMTTTIPLGSDTYGVCPA